ncbi:MAG: 3-deoxy-7-phosphoheptulonate synthase [Armatimonadetes bacterium]|nr:3-deoxy-7-phosphoheptulonate synthase [Armatimonadota bacterium]
MTRAMPGVRQTPVSPPVNLTSREHRSESTVVQVGPASFGGRRVTVIAGPCSVENRAQTLETALAVKAVGAGMIRGGAFKPRTSPYSFQGLEEEGLCYLAEVREATGLPIVTEAMDYRQVELVEKYADMIQIGARNMQNYTLLRDVGRLRRPVLLKRGPGATVQELLLAAEYILAEGNTQVLLCERGIRGFDTATRYTLDLSAVPLLKQLTHLPVIVDPSHATGNWTLVGPMARAALAAGADGLIIEVHPQPDRALSDGAQQLTPDHFAGLMDELRLVAAAVGRAL